RRGARTPACRRRRRKRAGRRRAGSAASCLPADAAAVPRRGGAARSGVESRPVSDVSAEPARSATELLSVRELVTEFATDRGVLRAVDGVSLEVPRGGAVGVVGE